MAPEFFAKYFIRRKMCCEMDPRETKHTKLQLCLCSVMLGSTTVAYFFTPSVTLTRRYASDCGYSRPSAGPKLSDMRCRIHIHVHMHVREQKHSCSMFRNHHQTSCNAENTSTYTSEPKESSCVDTSQRYRPYVYC